MKNQVSSPYRISILVAEFFQLLCLILVKAVDADRFLWLWVMFGVWIIFWVGVYFLVKFRVRPTIPELIALSFGPLAIAFVAIGVGEY